MAMGGYVAEKMIFGDDQVSTGPSSDLRTATKLARNMVMSYGMSDLLGPRTFGTNEELVFLGREIHESRDYSDKTAELIDNEIRKIVEEAEDRAKKVLTDHRSTMDKMVTVLIEKKQLNKMRSKRSWESRKRNW